MFTITATLDGEIVMDRKLAGLEERIADMTPAYPELTRVFKAIVARAFATEGASGDSGKWAPLAKSTVAERRRQGHGPEHPILQRSQTLERSLTGDTGDTISVEAPSYYARGSAVPYVAFHQSRAPRVRLPRRPVVAFTQDQKNELFLPLRRHATGHDANAPVRSRVE